MFLYIILGLLFILYLLGRIRVFRMIYFKSLVLPFSCILFIALMMLFSRSAVYSAHRGLTLWLNVVLPSLFPFFVVSHVLTETGFIRTAGMLIEPVMRKVFRLPGCSAFPFLMGITSGYPVGAQITADLRTKGEITKNEAERLLAFCNNSGPLFIVGAVATAMLRLPEAGILLLSCHVMAAITVGVALRCFAEGKPGQNKAAGNTRSKNIYQKIKKSFVPDAGANLGNILARAVSRSFSSMLMLGGFIILFSVVISFLDKLNITGSVAGLLSNATGVDCSLYMSVLTGLVEITSGISRVCSVPGIAPEMRLAAISFIAGWAGLSVHGQVKAITGKTDISMKYYLPGKLLQGLLSSVYTYVFVRYIKQDLIARAVFSPVHDMAGKSWGEYLLLSCRNICCVFAVIAVMLIFAAIARERRLHL